MLPALLALLAAVADASGGHGLARDALVGAVPFAAVAALTAFGAHLDDRDDAVGALQALLSALAATLIVLSCAVRSHAAAGDVPPLAESALVAALALFAAKAVVAAAPYARRLVLRPVKP